MSAAIDGSRPELAGQSACRFCRHDQYLHNLMQGCPNPYCRCMATPSEAGPRTDAELDASIIPPEQTLPTHVVPPLVVVPTSPAPLADSDRTLWERAVYDLTHPERGTFYASVEFIRNHPAMQEILRRERQKGPDQ